MRPNGEEMLRGIQQSLLTYVLPELQTEYARTELVVIIALLGIVVGEWDGAAQHVLDDNAALRELAHRGAEALAPRSGAAALAAELRSLAGEADASVRIPDLSAAHERLHDAVGRLGVFIQDAEAVDLRELRAAIIERLRLEAESRSYALLGPRADG